MKFRLIAIIKDFLLFSRIALILRPFQHILRFFVNLTSLTHWINRHRKTIAYSDFYRIKRNYQSREKLFQYLVDTQDLATEPILYLEFGVSKGISFRWWLNCNQHAESRFWGFDTFEGLPENWWMYKKGDMAAALPVSEDLRAEFVKGLFQETLHDFLAGSFKQRNAGGCRKVVHLDADLFSSTVFVLTSMAPYLREGDILLFDEFNVPNHEYAAWELFVCTYYVDYEVLGAVNNFYQVAIKYKGMARFHV